jgi:spermidine/putrescine transport system ATP-binding protein
VSTRRGSLIVRGASLGRGGAPVLRAIDFSVEAGEFVALLGPSGCGKTTLLRLVAGLETADEGEVMISGRDATRDPAHTRPVHTVFQNYALFPHLNVFENVAFGLRVRGAGAEVVRDRVREALALVRLEGLDTRAPHEISGGQAQRVALARALVLKPDILLLDEPLAALDARLRAEMRSELRRVQRTLQTTFVLVTHDLEEAIEVSDRVAVMERGGIAQFAPPRQVFEQPANRYVADLVGVKNFFAGRIVERSNGAALVDLGFLRVRVAEAPAADEVTLGLRNEHIRLVPAAASRLRGSVREARYLGETVRTIVEVPRSSRADAGSGADATAESALLVAETFAPLAPFLSEASGRANEIGIDIDDSSFIVLA